MTARRGSKEKATAPLREQSASGPAWDGEDSVPQFRRALINWFRRNQRQLPWRTEPNGYRIWVSEIMLQQTQVVTVIDYFNRFIARFPTIQSLAAAEEAEVLKLWEGLGYYRRARQMHVAAKKIASEHGGEFPENFEEVLALPGVGRYTAGAIMSIAFDRPFPILEGNTIRVFARLMGLQANAREKSGEQQLWAFSESLLPKGRGARDLNQGLMELGSEVCRVRQPDCPNCPVRPWCRAFTEGIQEKLPVLSPRMEYQSRHDALVIIWRGDRVLLRKCEEGEHWTGLWDFPRVTLAAAGPKADQAGQGSAGQVEQLLRREFGLNVSTEPADKRLKHAVTKYRITLDCYWGQLLRGLPKGEPKFVWMEVEQLDELALNGTGRKVATWLRQRGRLG